MLRTARFRVHRRTLSIVACLTLPACGEDAPIDSADDASLATNTDAGVDQDAQPDGMDAALAQDASSLATDSTAAPAPDASAPDAGPLKPATCDAVAPATCVAPAPSFEKDVKPMLSQRCLSCHDGLHEQWPLTTYDHVASWASQLRGEMLDCSMPPIDSGMDMPLAERQLLLAWLRCGLPR